MLSYFDFYMSACINKDAIEDQLDYERTEYLEFSNDLRQRKDNLQGKY